MGTRPCRAHEICDCIVITPSGSLKEAFFPFGPSTGGSLNCPRRQRWTALKSDRHLRPIRPKRPQRFRGSALLASGSQPLSSKRQHQSVGIEFIDLLASIAISGIGRVGVDLAVIAPIAAAIHVITARAVDGIDEITTLSTAHRVLAVVIDDAIATIVTIEIVTTSLAVDDSILTASSRVRVQPSVNVVTAVTAENLVAARTTEATVSVCPALNRISSVVAKHRVVPAVAVHVIGVSAAIHRVIGSRACAETTVAVDVSDGVSDDS